MHLRIHVDGGSRGNPGPAAAGVVIHDADTSTPLHEAGYFLGRTTNNVAEYSGLVKALELAVQLGGREVEIRSDSQLMVRQITGEYRVKSADLLPLFEKAQRLLKQFEAWHIQHVRRHLNARADELANAALDRGRDVVEESAAGFIRPAPGPGPAAVHRSPGPKPPGLRGPSNPDPGRFILVFDTAPVMDSGGCPAGTRAGETFHLGPDTPGGLCIHAAAIAISALLATPHKGQLLRCPRCQAQMRLQPVEANDGASGSPGPRR